MPRRPVCNFSVARSRPRARRGRYWIGAALGALALASPVAIAAPPAAAQAIQFISVTGDGSGDLAITVSSPAPLTSMTIHLTGKTDGQTLQLPLSDFSPQSPGGTTQAYALQDSATRLSGLAPDTYTATGDAADGAGDQVTGQNIPRSFNFLAQPVLAFSSPTFYTTQPNQPVTISGQITSCTTLACPSSWSGTSVTVTDVTAGAKPQWTTTNTDSSGDFSVSVTGVPGDHYSASIATTATTLAATAASDTVDVPQYAQTSITATAKPAAYGKQSIAGQLTYQPASGFTSVDAPAGVPITATAGRHTVSTTTGSNGDFSLALPAISGTTTWLIKSKADDLDSTPFLAGTEHSLSATQLWPVKIRFSASLDAYGDLTVAGCMSTTIRQRPPADYPLMWFQWRSRKSGPWHFLGSRPTMSHAGCAGLSFTGSDPRPPAQSAYYRADFLGDNVYAPAVSASTGRVWRYPTRFHGFRARPRSVAAGHKVTISGTLQYQEGGKWRGYGNEPVVILFAPSRKAKTWFLPSGGSVRTNSKGAFSWTFTDTRSDYWMAYYAGNDRHFVASAKPIRVKVHGRASSKPVALGQPIGLPSAELSARDSMWPFALSPDPWLVLVGD